MMDEKNSEDAKTREVLRMMDRMMQESKIPDYPDYRRGLRWGGIVGVLALAALIVFIVLSGQSNDIAGRLLRHGWTALAVGGVMFLLVGAIGAFRPPKD